MLVPANISANKKVAKVLANSILLKVTLHINLWVFIFCFSDFI